jgi:hypothetical protein
VLVAFLAERKVAYMVLLDKSLENRPVGYLGVDVKLILKRNLQEIG